CGTPQGVASRMPSGSTTPVPLSGIAADQAEDQRVPDLAAQLLHEPVVVDGIEEGFQVAIHRVDTPLLPTGFHPPHRLMGGSVGTETVAAIAEVALEERPQHLRQRLL